MGEVTAVATKAEAVVSEVMNMARPARRYTHDMRLVKLAFTCEFGQGAIAHGSRSRGLGGMRMRVGRECEVADQGNARLRVEMELRMSGGDGAEGGDKKRSPSTCRRSFVEGGLVSIHKHEHIVRSDCKHL
jgi:hypothetical protein